MVYTPCPHKSRIKIDTVKIPPTSSTLLVSTEDTALARKWAAEAGLLGHVDGIIAGGGVDMMSVFRGGCGKEHFLGVAWWGWERAEDNGFSAHRSPNPNIIDLLATYYRHNLANRPPSSPSIT